MQVWGLTAGHVAELTRAIGLDVDNLRPINGKSVALRVVPLSSRAKYARTTPNGRKLKATCYHGFRDAINAYFNAGATRVKSTFIDVRGPEDFRDTLYACYSKMIGNFYESQEFGELCQCETDGDNYLTGAVL